MEALRDSQSVQVAMNVPQPAVDGNRPAPALGDPHDMIVVRVIPRQQQIMREMEFLFSVDRMSQNRQLYRVMLESTGGFVSFAMLLSYNRIATLHCSLEELAEAASKSAKLEVSLALVEEREAEISDLLAALTYY